MTGFMLQTEMGDNPQPVTVVLLGEPVPMVRMRHAKSASYPYVPKRQRDTAAALKLVAQGEMGDRLPLDCPLHVEFLAELPIPASWSKKKQSAALLGEILPTRRPDLDNIWKLGIDALNTVVFRDDALICEGRKRKVYSHQPKIVITVSPMKARGVLL